MWKTTQGHDFYKMKYIQEGMESKNLFSLSSDPQISIHSTLQKVSNVNNCFLYMGPLEKKNYIHILSKFYKWYK